MDPKTRATVAKSISQISLTFAVLGLIGGILLMSPTGRFAGFAVMAICGTVAFAAGPRTYRMVGLLALLIGLAGSGSLYGEFRADPYYTRGHVRNAYHIARQYVSAADAFYQANKVWPRSLEQLGPPLTSGSVRSVLLEPNGVIRVILSVSRLEGKAFVYSPEIRDGRVEWRCSGPGIPGTLLPEGCRTP